MRTSDSTQKQTISVNSKDADLSNVSECRYFINDGRTSSATRCICGKEKWEHDNC